MVESEHSNQMSLTVVIPGAVLTGRLAPESLWRQRVAEVLRDSDRLGAFAAVFAGSDGPRAPHDPPEGAGPPERADGDSPRPVARPTHLHFHVARILQGNVGIPDTGGMYRVALKDVSAWTVGAIGYADH
ncbi:hypothetical protein [Streptomyces minutiscleroticus]|nr:hypothetical protein [Streptomyces minutiscleroticus]